MRKNNNDNAGRKKLRILWCCLIVTVALLYSCYSGQLTRENIAHFLLHYHQQVWVLYFLICVLRGLLLLPSTPFLLAGILIFNDTPMLLWLVFLLSIFLVAAFIYYAVDYAGFSHLAKKIPPKKRERIRQQLNGQRGFWLILGWAFTPFTPTDLVCYAAGSFRIRFWRFMIPLLIGEAIICAIYIFNGHLLLR